MKKINLDAVVKREMIKAVESILETRLNQNDEEKKKQDRLSKAVSDRGIVSDADDDMRSQDEAEEESDSKEKKDDDSSKEEKEKREDRTKGKGTADSPKVKTPKSGTIKTPTIGAIVDKLNALRGGRSLKDPSVKNSFAQYFEGLSNNERQTLLAFLTGIAQILAGTKKGAQAMEPSDIGIASKKTEPQKEEKPETKSTAAKTSAGTEENPIVVGENKKYDVVRALEAYRQGKQ